MKRISLIFATAAMATMAASNASATCTGFHCSDSIRGVLVDETAANAYVSLGAQDESALSCSPTNGPAPFLISLELKRNSPIFTEAYQILLLAGASALPVRIDLRPNAGAPCEVVRVTLDPYSFFP